MKNLRQVKIEILKILITLMLAGMVIGATIWFVKMAGQWINWPQGQVTDYGQYFRNSPEITEESARTRGLLSRAKGESGYRIGREAIDEVYASFNAGKISAAKTEAKVN